jgi:hypothetical protein
VTLIGDKNASSDSGNSDDDLFFEKKTVGELIMYKQPNLTKEQKARKEKMQDRFDAIDADNRFILT